MSNALAIEAVTTALRNLIVGGVPDLPNQNVTTKPLDRARTGDTRPDQLNLFLYQTVLNAAWRNMDLPRQVRAGETGQPPLALNLYYLVTAYGQGDDETLSHRWLGQAMAVLHDHPLLTRDEIRAALATSELHTQFERIRITAQPLSLEEMSKLWTTFQTQYRISASYEVMVVLIESTRRSRTPLPVLRRGPDDSGVATQPDLVPPFPTILNIRPPNQQASVRLGEELTITGFHLDGDAVAVRFTNPPLAISRTEAAAGTADEVKVTVPNDSANFPPGFYTVAVRVSKANEADRFTNEFPLQVAPVISNIAPVSAPAGNVTVTLTCSPNVRPEQRATLLFGDREIPAQPHAAPTNTLVFNISAAARGDYFLRLRVDGVDSPLVIRTGSPPTLQFDPNQRMTIT